MNLDDINISMGVQKCFCPQMDMEIHIQLTLLFNLNIQRYVFPSEIINNVLLDESLFVNLCSWLQPNL